MNGLGWVKKNGPTSISDEDLPRATTHFTFYNPASRIGAGDEYYGPVGV